MKAANLFIALTLVTLVALFSKQSPPQAIPDKQVFSVDGVSLGMTRGEVEEVWGKVDTQIGFDGRIILHKGEFSPFQGYCAWLGRDGRVGSVGGNRLRFGGNLVLGIDHDFEAALSLGSEFQDHRLQICGNSGPLRGAQRDLGESVIEAYALNLEFGKLPADVTLEQALRQDPSLDNIIHIELTSKNYLEQNEESLERLSNYWTLQDSLTNIARHLLTAR